MVGAKSLPWLQRLLGWLTAWMVYGRSVGLRYQQYIKMLENNSLWMKQMLYSDLIQYSNCASNEEQISILFIKKSDSIINRALLSSRKHKSLVIQKHYKK